MVEQETPNCVNLQICGGDVCQRDPYCIENSLCGDCRSCGPFVFKNTTFVCFSCKNEEDLRVTVAQCKHYYCINCVSKFKRVDYKGKCPLCNALDQFEELEEKERRKEQDEIEMRVYRRLQEGAMTR